MKKHLLYLIAILMIAGCAAPTRSAQPSSLPPEELSAPAEIAPPISDAGEADNSAPDISARSISAPFEIIGLPDKIHIVVNSNETVIEKGTAEYNEIIGILESRFPEKLHESQREVSWADESGFDWDAMCETFNFVLLSYNDKQYVDLSGVSADDTASSKISFDQMLFSFSNSGEFCICTEEAGLKFYEHLNQKRSLYSELIDYNKLPESHYQQLYGKYAAAADMGVPDRAADNKYTFDDRSITLEDSIDNKLEQLVYELYYYECSAEFEKREALFGEHKAIKQTNKATNNHFNEGLYMSDFVIHKLTTLSAQDMGRLERYAQEDIVSKISEYDFQKYAVVQADVSWKHNELSLSRHPQVPDGRYFRYYLIASTADDPVFKLYDIYWDMYNELEDRESPANKVSSAPSSLPPDAEEAVISLSAEPIFWHGQTRIPLHYKNNGAEPVWIRDKFKLERLDNGVWSDCAKNGDEPPELDEDYIDGRIKPGKQRSFWADIGWAAEQPNGAYMPEGSYRLTVEISDGSFPAVEFELQSDMPDYGNGVTVSMEQPSYPVGQDKLKMLITNRSANYIDEAYDIYHIEQLLSGEWTMVKRGITIQGESGNLPVLLVTLNETVPFIFYPQEDGYELPAGYYRVVKKLGDLYYAAEFEIVRQ